MMKRSENLLDANTSNAPVIIGIIGGSGLDDPDILDERVEKPLITPYGTPSDVLIEGKISGVRCYLIARHGRKHSIMPSNVNYRANIWALREMGCTHILATTACGSLSEEIHPGDLVIPNDFIDRTTKRVQTFYDGAAESPIGVCHLTMYPSFNERLRAILIASARQLSIPVIDKATVVAIEGPRYSSRAESNMFRSWGGDLINMTTCPEVVLVKEAGLPYGALAIATDYDCWRNGFEGVTAKMVTKNFEENVDKVKKILCRAVENICREDWVHELAAVKETAQSNVLVS